MVFLLLNVAEQVTLSGTATAVSFQLPESMQFLITVECTAEVEVEFKIQGAHNTNLMQVQLRSAAQIQKERVKIYLPCNKWASDQGISSFYKLILQP